MEKPAPCDYPIDDAIRRRWSPFGFAERLVESEKLRSVLEAARWAPSGFNEQPWRFLIATRDDEAGYERLLGCLMPGNKGWACRAPVLVLAVAKLRFSHNNNENRHALYDTGAAVENLILQATSLGLFAHPMGGFDRDETRRRFAIPAEFEPVVAIALGYPCDLEDVPEALRERQLAPRKRRPLAETVFSGTWGEAAKLVAGE